MASNNNNNNNNKKRRGTTAAAAAAATTNTTGLDGWLQLRGKQVSVGDSSIRLRLIKGSALQQQSIDPVDPVGAPPEQFPLIAKFPVSTIPPEFVDKKQQRLYQQDVPKPVDSSDEDDDDVDDNNNEGGGGGTKKKKKRWRYYNSQKAPPRQWILQSEVDFLQTMMDRRRRQAASSSKQQQQQKQATSPPPPPTTKPSRYYEGFPEYNPSHYVLFKLQQLSQQPQPQQQEQPVVVTVRSLPTPHSVVTFHQPNNNTNHAGTAILTLSQAEQALQDQRAAAAAGIIHHHDPTKSQQPSQKNSTKNRLLQKLEKAANANNEMVEEGDDVMADVTFRERKGGGRMARRELLDFAAEGLAVSHDGVLGGSNDAAFAGRGQRFGNFQVVVNDDTGSGGGAAAAKTGGGGGGGTEERGADGAAMEDDFYTRDVQAEYEELDYDANEQFDDDDVDVGETEVVAGGAGFGGGEGDEEDELDEDDEDEDADAEQLKGAEGLATVAGFKELLAKARGETVPEHVAAAAAVDNKRKRSVSPKLEKETDHIAKIMAAAAAEEKPKAKADAQNEAPAAAAAAAKKPASVAAAAAAEEALQLDENGLRILTLKAVQREIWLNHGSIPSKRLIRIFSAKKKDGADRPAKFKQIVKELCTMKQDPIDGAILVLKQHYSHFMD